MKLSALLKALPDAAAKQKWICADPEIVSIHYRADTVEPGGLFVAIPGLAADGHDFIDQALERGAAAVIVEKDLQKDGIFVQVANSRQALSALSARFYHQPSEKMTVIGITGTNGKTTTSYLVESMLAACGIPCGVIGTINYRYKGKVVSSTMTTPESLEIHKILAEMVDEGIEHAVLETSSHAIDLDRIRNVCIRVGLFTNLSQDHLDYHKDMDAYWSCKKRLFTECLDHHRKDRPAVAVINCLHEKGRELQALLEKQPNRTELITIGDRPGCSIRVLESQITLAGIQASVATPNGEMSFRSSLVGRFNLENILCALGAGCALDLPAAEMKMGVETFESVPGRLEPVVNASGRYVFVDYAHTPDALENVLFTLKALATGRLICVFGCGGDRDRGKRPLMGSIAGKLSDLCIITSDNPRTEDRMQIIDDILEGVRPVQKKVAGHADALLEGYLVEPDRKKAIRLGIETSLPGDTVLIAGKGHEDYQIIGTTKTFFDDRLEANDILKQMEAV